MYLIVNNSSSIHFDRGGGHYVCMCACRARESCMYWQHALLVFRIAIGVWQNERDDLDHTSFACFILYNSYWRLFSVHSYSQLSVGFMQYLFAHFVSLFLILLFEAWGWSNEEIQSFNHSRLFLFKTILSIFAVVRKTIISLPSCPFPRSTRMNILGTLKTIIRSKIDGKYRGRYRCDIQLKWIRLKLEQFSSFGLYMQCILITVRSTILPTPIPCIWLCRSSFRSFAKICYLWSSNSSNIVMILHMKN